MPEGACEVMVVGKTAITSQAAWQARRIVGNRGRGFGSDVFEIIVNIDWFLPDAFALKLPEAQLVCDYIRQWCMAARMNPLQRTGPRFAQAKVRSSWCRQQRRSDHELWVSCLFAEGTVARAIRGTCGCACTLRYSMICAALIPTCSAQSEVKQQAPKGTRRGTGYSLLGSNLEGIAH